jgi:hypothetical protein
MICLEAAACVGQKQSRRLPPSKTKTCFPSPSTWRNHYTFNETMVAYLVSRFFLSVWLPNINPGSRKVEFDFPCPGTATPECPLSRTRWMGLKIIRKNEYTIHLKTPISCLIFGA